MKLTDLQKIDDWTWEIPMAHRSDMRVAVRVFGTRELLEDIIDDRSLEQAVNCATLPGVVGNVYVMPDVHQARIGDLPSLRSIPWFWHIEIGGSE